jgi:NADH-quinone oxidoreductase subunit N
MHSLSNLESFGYFLPETILSSGVLVLFVVDLLVRDHPQRARILTGLTLACVGLAAVVLYGTTHRAGAIAETFLFNGLIAQDPLAVFFKYVFFLAAAIGVLMAQDSNEIERSRLGEYYALLLSIVMGMCLMAEATDLLMVYLSIELVSVVSYVLSGFHKGDRKSTEASLKYVIYGGVASGVMLFGMSYLYGLFGTTQIPQIGHQLAQFAQQTFKQEAFVGAGAADLSRLVVVVSIVFVLAGVGYKVASVPWHMWCPDVYEGAPTPFTGFLSVGPKAAGFAVAIRLFYGAMTSGPQYSGNLSALAKTAQVVSDVPWPAIVGVMAAVTMTLGNFAAINQTNLKRLLAYSSIAHAGYLLMGLSAASPLGNLAVMLYLVFYLFMNLGAFLIIGAVAKQEGSESIFEYRGLGRRAPVAAVTFAIFLFSLTGIPPLAGFVGKFYLFYAVVAKAIQTTGSESAGYWTLALIGAVNSAISLYYYARIVKAMFLEQGFTEEPVHVSRMANTLAVVLSIALLVFGVYWQIVTDVAEPSMRMMRG